MGIEAGSPSAKAYVMDTAKTSATHASVAIASFTLSFPLDKRAITQYEALLKSKQPQLNEAQRKALTKSVEEGAIANSMFAMLAKQRGKWKIICMSLPK